MRHLILARAFAAAVLAVASVALPALAQGQPPAAEVFFQHPSFEGPALSPNGRQMLVRMIPKGGTRLSLYVIDTDKFTAKQVAAYKDIDITAARWISDKRIVFDVVDRGTRSDQTNYTTSGMVAVDSDGSNLRQ